MRACSAWATMGTWPKPVLHSSRPQRPRSRSTSDEAAGIARLRCSLSSTPDNSRRTIRTPGDPGPGLHRPEAGVAGDRALRVDAHALTPVEQEPLPDGPLDEALARIAWPDGVTGCALSQEILLLPPSAEADIDFGEPAEAAAAHPDRREARIVAAVLRDGSSAVVLRLRAAEATGDDDLLTGDDLAPNLVRALLDTFA